MQGIHNAVYLSCLCDVVFNALSMMKCTDTLKVSFMVDFVLIVFWGR